MNHKEILFVYDNEYNNPNGDPIDENKPRMDEDNDINLVSDVRLKRTIRDYLADYKNEKIFVKADMKLDGNVQSLSDRLISETNVKEMDFENNNHAKQYVKEELLDNYIDIRLFGGVIAPGSLKVKINGKSDKFGSVPITAPVQFRMGKSLHEVKVKEIQGTGAFASGDSVAQNTFRTEYVVPYSLIGFYGCVNANAAESTKLTEDDLILLREGIWSGTRTLITRSKFGQLPRIYLEFEYDEPNFFIGDLNNRISIDYECDGKSIRNIDEVEFDLTKLINCIEKYNSKISKIYCKFDDDVKFKDYNAASLINKLSNYCPVEELDL